jgi:hypothetical protein
VGGSGFARGRGERSVAPLEGGVGRRVEGVRGEGGDGHFGFDGLGEVEAVEGVGEGLGRTNDEGRRRTGTKEEEREGRREIR